MNKKIKGYEVMKLIAGYEKIYSFFERVMV